MEHLFVSVLVCVICKLSAMCSRIIFSCILLLVTVVLWVCMMYIFVWSFIGLRNGEDLINYSSMGGILIETDVKYVCEICRCFLT